MGLVLLREREREREGSPEGPQKTYGRSQKTIPVMVLGPYFNGSSIYGPSRKLTEIGDLEVGACRSEGCKAIKTVWFLMGEWIPLRSWGLFKGLRVYGLGFKVWGLGCRVLVGNVSL